MTDDYQSEALAFLANPNTHGLRDGESKHIRTHISEIFLAGDRAFKVKRAVRYTFVDLTTLASRHAACDAEIRLNRRTAPEIYLGVVAVRRGADGRLSLDEPSHQKAGEPIEWAVVMRRFDESLTLDRLADHKRLQPKWIDGLVDAAIDLHRNAQSYGRPFGGASGLGKIIDGNATDMAALSDHFPPKRLAWLLDSQRKLLSNCADLLESRRDAGLVRRCHGDLHLGNVVLWHDRPTIFDCIEFSDDIATIDVAYDLAFLLMDLETRGLRPLANRALSRYLGRQGGVEVLAALPLMMSLRAAVRAKVTAMTIAELDNPPEAARTALQAEQLFQAAERFASPAPQPSLVAIGGLSGTGKTTLAAALAPELGRAPGALLLRSDVIRKRLANVAPEQRLPESAYTPEANRQVYETLSRETTAALAAGQSVVTDAVFSRESERRACEDAAAEAGVKFFGIWLEAPSPLLKTRVTQRTADASDATPDVVSHQLSYETGSITWTRIDSSAEPGTVLSKARALLPKDSLSQV